MDYSGDINTTTGYGSLANMTDPYIEFPRTLGQKRYELTNHLGNVLAVISDKKIIINISGTNYYDAEVITAQDYYAFGAPMPGRSYQLSGVGGYRYGFNGKEKDDEVKGAGDSYDYGARMYDSRLGRWMSMDPLMSKYPGISPYIFVVDMPMTAIDKDGRDIIILSDPSAVAGLGHGAVLIGNDKDGWTLYSKNGTWGSVDGSKSSGPANKNPENGIYFKSLSEFANSTSNFNEDDKGDVKYTSAFRITTSKETDKKMAKAAAAQVGKWYDVTGTISGSCIDVAEDALKAGGLDPGYDFDNSADGKTGEKTKSMSPFPNHVYKNIRKNNAGADATKSITPSDDTKKEMRDNSVEGQKAQKKSDEQQGQQNIDNMDLPPGM